MQQNVRATVNLIAKDVSMAGSGLPSGGLSLPAGAGSVASFFAVSPAQAWLANNGYPKKFMFGIIPGAGNGIELGGPANIAATGTPSDAITVIYADYAFPLNQYATSIPVANPLGRQGKFRAAGGSARRLSSHSVSHRNSGWGLDPVHQQ